MTTTTPATSLFPLPTTIPVPPGCPQDLRTWLQGCLAPRCSVRREAENVLDVLDCRIVDGVLVTLTAAARTWLERLALETTTIGGHAREALLLCGGRS